MILRNWLEDFRDRLLAPDVDGGGGGGGGDDDGDVDPPQDPPAKTFTQAELDRIIQDRLKKLQREQKQKDKDMESMRAELEELKKKADGGNPDPGDANKGQVGDLELKINRLTRELEQTNTKLAEAQKQASEEANKRKRTERDKELSDALVAAGCIDMVGGRRYFAEQIVWDEVENKWAYETKSGSQVSIADGVMEELPPYLKPAQMNQGGSGSGGTNPKKKKVQADLDVAKKKLDEIKSLLMQNNGNVTYMSQYAKQQKVVKQLEGQLAT